MQNNLVQELQDAISDTSSDRRRNALQKVTDLLLGHGEHLTDEQIALFDDVLLSLVIDCDAEALIDLSRKLAPASFAPLSVLQRLAGHLDAKVASPVLAQSAKLTSSDLVDIASSRGKGHLLAIAERIELDATLTEALIELGDRDVRYKVVSNDGAKITRTGFLRLIGTAARDPLLAEKTGLRTDLPVRLLRELLENTVDAVRSRILAKAPSSLRAEIQKHVDTITQEKKREAERPRDLRSAVDMVERLKEARQLTEDKLAEFAKDRQYESVIAALAAMTASPIELIQPLMRVHRHDGLMIACRAADLSWETAKAVILSRLLSMPAADLDKIRQKYAEVSFSAAKRALYIWQEQTLKPRRAG